MQHWFIYERLTFCLQSTLAHKAVYHIQWAELLHNTSSFVNKLKSTAIQYSSYTAKYSDLFIMAMQTI
jgi:hypothetical protein